ncbi:MAG: metal-dependent hydrolase [Candidatus Aenigmatarchaeota archaeon]
MRFNTHLLGGGLLLWMLGFSGVELLLGLLLSVLPDIDTPRSHIGRIFPFSGWIEENIGHRSITHSLLFVVVAALGGGLGPLVGALSHILLDMLTPNGVQLLWPENMNFIILGGTIPTGSNKERVVFALMLLAGIVFGYMQLCNLESREILRNLFRGDLMVCKYL